MALKKDENWLITTFEQKSDEWRKKFRFKNVFFDITGS